MLGGVGVEAVRGQGVVAPKEPETLGGHDEMQKTRRGADGAVALGNLEPRGGIHLEADAAAVTAAAVRDEGFSGGVLGQQDR